MTPERARELWDMRGPNGPKFAFCEGEEYHRQGAWCPEAVDLDGITKKEHKYILKVWDTMPRYTCYEDAIVRIAGGYILKDESLAEIKARIERGK